MFNTTQPFVYLYAMYVRIIRSFNIGYFIVNFGYKYLPALIQITFVVWLSCICTNRICRLPTLYWYLSHLSFGNPAFVPIAWPHWIRNLIRALFYKECGVGASAAHQYQDWKLNYGQNLFKA